MIVKSSVELVSNIQNALQAESEYPKKIPIFINARDRVGCLRQLTDWLSGAGYSNVAIIDNASTYPDMIAFLWQCPYPVLRSTRNLGHTALWRISGLRSIIRSEWFVYTDPDVVPIESCPSDVVSYLYELLSRHPDYVKAGIGLVLADIPDQFHLKQSVIRWEENLYGREIEANVYEADIDTTFALYRPGSPCLAAPSLRTRGDYQGRHLPWYMDSQHTGDEEQYYRDHALASVTHWNTSGANASHQNLLPQGGMTAEVMNDPKHFLQKLVHSKTWAVAAPLRWFERISGKTDGINLDFEHLTPEELRSEIMKILTSGSWRFAERLKLWRSRWQTPD